MLTSRAIEGSADREDFDLELGDKASATSVYDEKEEDTPRNVSIYELAGIFRPYFWPHSTTNKVVGD